MADLKSWVPQGACGFEARPRHSPRSRSVRAGRGLQALGRRRGAPRPAGSRPAPGTNIVNKYDIREATNFTTRTDAAEFLKTRISNELDLRDLIYELLDPSERREPRSRADRQTFRHLSGVMRRWGLKPM